MPKETFPMTEAGLEKITEELRKLEHEKREHAKTRIKKARSFCDFQEDPEYEKAVEDLARIEERISSKRYKIQHVKLIEKTGGSYVELGNTVTFKEVSENQLETYTIVGSEEADPFEGKISNKSQVAQSLLGAKVNDEVMIQAPDGNRQVKIISIS